MSEATLVAWSGRAESGLGMDNGESEPPLDPVIRSIVRRHQSLVADLAALQGAIQRVVQSRAAIAGQPVRAPTLRSQEITALRARARSAQPERRPHFRLFFVTLLLGLAVASVLYMVGGTESAAGTIDSADFGPADITLPVTTADGPASERPASGIVSVDTSQTSSATIPAGQPIASADAAAETGSAESATTPVTITVTVQPGDTIVGLAVRHHTTVAAIANLNALRDPNVITVGQSLRIEPDRP